ncbi:uncharacterized protein LOC107433874 [Ziziphus jujuba]|uniref:Uncharacterized protein LOC107433874 n=1 Tax=Ziziphus jujuba TaxID=326968 RepID=A0ABM4A7L0_ZIZJJ|nr:uncharacterized protein LOC107433874 [Ziziphus jujuba]
MLEKAKQRNKIHQATIAMLRQMSSEEGRLLQILAGLPGTNQKMIQHIGQKICKRFGKRLHEAIPWEGHGAGNGAGTEVGPGVGQGARHGARDGTGQNAGQGAGQGAGLGAVGLDCALGQHEDLLDPIIEDVVVGATHILNMCTMLEKAKQCKKTNQATIAMLSKMSSKEGRLLQILAGLPKNQPEDGLAHWPGDVQRVGPRVEGLDWVLERHEAIPWERHGASCRAGLEAGQGTGQGAGHGALHGAREGAGQDLGEGLGKELG